MHTAKVFATAFLVFSSFAMAAPVEAYGHLPNFVDDTSGTESAKRAEAYGHLPNFVDDTKRSETDKRAEAYGCPSTPNRVARDGAVPQAYPCTNEPNRVLV